MHVEIYSPQRKAQFLLSNAVDAEDHARAVEEVRKLGVDPAIVPHIKPPDVRDNEDAQSRSPAPEPR
jgi:hypothetical protein